MRNTVVTSAEQVASNIYVYTNALARYPALVSRLAMHPAWYALKGESGEWLFGPSKFIGYRDADPAGYLDGYDRKDGRETEPALRQFSTEVEPDSSLGLELAARFREFAARYGKTPKSSWRVRVVRDDANDRRTYSASTGPISSRIAFDSNICGGRPRIAGTRVRVSDIVAALGAGESIADILEDFPYLKEADIYAALDYAAKAVDHRVLRAA